MVQDIKDIDKVPGVRDHLNAFLDLPPLDLKHVTNGPLAGLTFGVKETFDIAGYKTTCSNPEFYQEAPITAKNAPFVQQLLDAGAKFVGKTQCDEFAWCLSGLSTHLPAPINPNAPERTTGGSSSGMAAAVAGGLVDIGFGTDAVGSIRSVANFCGLIGLRPTHDRVPLEGLFTGSPSLEVIGWFAKNMDIYEKVSRILIPNYTEPKDVKIRLIRFPVAEEALMGDDERKEYQRMVEVVEKLHGPATKKDLKISPEEYVQANSYFRAYEAWEIAGDWFKAKPRTMTPAVRKRFEFAQTVTKEMVDQAGIVRNKFREHIRELLAENNILIMPTTPSCALLRTAGSEEWNDFRDHAGRLATISPLTGFPEISLPIGSVHGAPFGISLLGRPNEDELLMKLGREVLESVGKA